MASLLPRPPKNGNRMILLLPPPLVVAEKGGSSLSLSEEEELEAGTVCNTPDPLLDSASPDNNNGEYSSSTTAAAKVPPKISPQQSPLPRCLGSPRSPKKSIIWPRVVAVARFIASGLKTVVTVAAAAAATLIAYWSLFPLCTSCRRVGHGTAGSSAAEAATTVAVVGETAPYSTLRINQLQVVGTHNSYHRRAGLPAVSDLWPYHFPPLADQLDSGVRHLELDVHYDWKTGRWFVYHISVLDPLSTCHCLSSCLEEIKQWSDRNPTHHIIFIDIELKLTGDFLRICGRHTPDTDKSAFLDLQNSVLDVFPRDRILTPREVRGDYATVYEAVKASGICGSASGGEESRDDTGAGASTGYGTSGSSSGGSAGGGGARRPVGGWPLVDDTRGMVVFVMDYQTVNVDCRDGIREALPIYETVFFERIPTNEIKKNSPYAAFTQLCQCEETWRRKNEKIISWGFIIRQHPESHQWVNGGAGETTAAAAAAAAASLLAENKTYLADTPAQLLVSDDLLHVGAKGVCHSRCTPMVPAEECILKGFC